MQITIKPCSSMPVKYLINRYYQDNVDFPVSGDALHKPLTPGEEVEMIKHYTNHETGYEQALHALTQGVERFKTTNTPEDLTALVNVLNRQEALFTINTLNLGEEGLYTAADSHYIDTDNLHQK